MPPRSSSSLRWRTLATLLSDLRFSRAPLALLLLTGVAGCPAEQNGAAPVQAKAAPADAAGIQTGNANKKPEDVRYDGTISGLKRLIRDLRVAISQDDQAEVAVLIASLRLVESDQWMTQVFGEELGRTLSAEYKPQREEIGLLVEVVAEQFEKGLNDIRVDRFQTPEVPSSTGYQSEALKKMVTMHPLYSVRLVSDDGQRSFHLWSFVHENGSFRYLGKLRSVAEKRISGGRDLNEYRLTDAARLAAKDPER